MNKIGQTFFANTLECVKKICRRKKRNSTCVCGSGSINICQQANICVCNNSTVSSELSKEKTLEDFEIALLERDHIDDEALLIENEEVKIEAEEVKKIEVEEVKIEGRILE